MTAPTKMWVLLFLEHLLNVGNVLLIHSALPSHLSDKIARIFAICHILKSSHKLTHLWILLHKHLQNHLRISPCVFHSEDALQRLVNVIVWELRHSVLPPFFDFGVHQFSWKVPTLAPLLRNRDFLYLPLWQNRKCQCLSILRNP